MSIYQLKTAFQNLLSPVQSMANKGITANQVIIAVMALLFIVFVLPVVTVVNRAVKVGGVNIGYIVAINNLYLGRRIKSLTKL